MKLQLVRKNRISSSYDQINHKATRSIVDLLVDTSAIVCNCKIAFNTLTDKFDQGELFPVRNSNSVATNNRSDHRNIDIGGNQERKSGIGTGKIILNRAIGRDHLPSFVGGFEDGLSAAVTIEPVIESHLFLLPNEVKRPTKRLGPIRSRISSSPKPFHELCYFSPGVHAHTFPITALCSVLQSNPSTSLSYSVELCRLYCFFLNTLEITLCLNVTEMIRVHLWIELPVYFQLSNFMKCEISKH